MGSKAAELAAHLQHVVFVADQGPSAHQRLHVPNPRASGNSGSASHSAVVTKKETGLLHEAAQSCPPQPGVYCRPGPKIHKSASPSPGAQEALVQAAELEAYRTTLSRPPLSSRLSMAKSVRMLPLWPRSTLQNQHVSISSIVQLSPMTAQRTPQASLSKLPQLGDR